MDDFTIEYKNYFGIIIKKNGVSIEIAMSPQEDIYFRSEKSTEIVIDPKSRDDDEFETAKIFMELMERIFGRDDLMGNDIKDFLNRKNKTISIMTDTNDVLSLSFNEDKKIVWSYTKVENNGYVRIRESGFSYMGYYQLFRGFYIHLKSFAERVAEREIRGRGLVKETQYKE